MTEVEFRPLLTEYFEEHVGDEVHVEDVVEVEHGKVVVDENGILDEVAEAQIVAAVGEPVEVVLCFEYVGIRNSLTH